MLFPFDHSVLSVLQAVHAGDKAWVEVKITWHCTVISYHIPRVFCVQLNDLISQAVSHKSELASPWQILPDTPVESCTALAFDGALLAVGGSKDDDGQSAKCMHMFKPSARTWVEAGCLPTNQWRCACALLPTSEIFIAGGAVNRSGFGARANYYKSEVHIIVVLQ